MIKQKIILIGGGGHCKACIDVIENTNQYSIEGILDDIGSIGKDVLGYKIIGTDSDIVKYKELGFHFLITVGQIKSASVRKKIYGKLEEIEARIVTIISPRASVSRHAKIGYGSIVMHNVTVNADVSIGNNCILNTGCNIEHDVVIGDNCHISTCAVINGGSIVGDEVFIGSNATISNQITLNNNLIIGAGSVVTKNINQSGTYAGNPVNIK